MADSRYRLLDSKEESYQSEDLESNEKHEWRRKRLLGLSLLLTFLLSTSIVCNLVMFSRIMRDEPGEGRSPFSGLRYDTPVVYRGFTEYWSDNETRSDELWDALNTDPVAMQVSDEWAAEHNLPKATRFPWDHSKGIYFIKAFHQIHCLKVMRKMAKDFKNTGKSDVTWEHFQHCVDNLRQDIMCRADDTPMFSAKGDFAGDGQVMQCRNWDKLIAWIQAPERNACYTQFGDFRPVEHKLEQYAFCPPDSPYYEVSNAYFEKWGHKDPFTSD